MISENIARIQERIATACARCGRDPAEITLVSVSKTFPASLVREVVASGISNVGENYVQELLQKQEELHDLPIKWHFIGHLQKNKVRQIIDRVELIHSVDSEPLAREINRRAEAIGKIVEVLMEVNTTAERSKFGVLPEETVGLIRSCQSFASISIAGLMTIGPFLPDPEGSRPMFRTLRRLSDTIRGLQQTNVSMRHLSMGMTGDFEVAIEEGATIIRVGTAMFGRRKKND